MSLNDIQLNAQLLAGLYSKSLIGDADETSVAIPAISAPEVKANISEKKVPAAIKANVSTSQNSFKSLGNNQKNVLICVNYTESANMPDAQLQFLTNLLKACKLGLNDVAIINMNNFEDASYTDILENFKSKVVMLFGLTAQQFGFPFEIPEYQVQQFAGKTVIHSPALHEIENDKVEKGKLWMSLKKIFSV